MFGLGGRKWYGRVFDSMNISHPPSPEKRPATDYDAISQASTSFNNSSSRTTSDTKSSSTSTDEDETTLQPQLQIPEIVHDDQPSTSQATIIAQQRLKCCFIRPNRIGEEGIRPMANGELPHSRKKGEPKKSEFQHIKTIILEGIKKPEKRAAVAAARFSLTTLPPLLINGGMRVNKRSDLLTLSSVTASDQIQLSQLTTEQVAESFSKATLPVPQMTRWSGDLMDLWCYNGSIEPDYLYNQASTSQQQQSFLPMVRLCSEQHQVLCKRMAASSYGCVYISRPVKSTKPGHAVPLVAVKVEQRKEQQNHRLQDELLAYQLLHPPTTQPESVLLGIVQPRFCVRRRAMILPMLGPNLEDLLIYIKEQNKQKKIKGLAFSLHAVANIGAQVICRLEHMHSCGLIHRDVKPSNLLFGHGAYRNVVHLIDLGLAKRWRLSMSQGPDDLFGVCSGQLPLATSGRSLDDTVAEKRAMELRRPTQGSARFASLNAHKGVELSRRDDLESLGYVIAYLLRNGNLPWQSLDSGRQDKAHRLQKIYARKAATSIEQLFRGFPPEFAIYMSYVRQLGFVDKPDYHYLRSLMKTVIDKHCGGTHTAYQFEWTTSEIPACAILTLPSPTVVVTAQSPSLSTASTDFMTSSDSKVLPPLRCVAIYQSL